ncbi:probable LRR receptor-like serine/threonine-protein kinase At3g47570 [Actinidia eriantha]|uniref:probable LRR receptor-like serine/threonine-protein kinase At3g47570 n=1 Tax=Actinidia eriantha TaxID=165200 RepID=UPI0025848C94|nr:probable LRR receptor-like serine/threonine-protein kinase At3g47570 [Actinidia eriantha]
MDSSAKPVYTPLASHFKLSAFMSPRTNDEQKHMANVPYANATNLISLEFLDLSSNALSGTIPRSLENLLFLRDINVSFNHLHGEIPSGGVFANSSAKSFMGNQGLCGLPRLQVPTCASNTPQGSGSKTLLLKLIIPVIASVTLIAALVFLWIMHRRKKREVSNPVDLLQTMTHQMVSYYELQQATNNFNESTLLGVGSFGSVYKGILSGGTVVAIKVLNLLHDEAFKSFDAECEVMRRIRHRNLVEVITTCSNLDFRAIVLPYMPNGSLENWLHKQNYHLGLLQRINIMLDVAMAVDYLHHGIKEPVVHCDLKPSNVLLDENMVAHVSDFGISKMLAENKPIALTKTLGTIGYIAPEYGSEGIVSTHGDVYSYGIMLMETFTKRRPTEEMFTENLTLRQWVKGSYPSAVMEIIDANLFNGEEEKRDRQENCLWSIIELALDCSAETPEGRITMKDVVLRLEKIKQRIMAETNKLPC